MISNPIQFAVVREDPEIETTLMQTLPVGSRVMLIGSGGCTALTLSARFPSVAFTIVEPNKSQIELIEKKLLALKSPARNQKFGIGTDSALALNNCGNFESLFRSLRNFLYEFVLDREDWIKIFSSDNHAALIDRAFASKYWPVAFQLFFSDPILVAMFGPQAIQHATPGSYPRYFQNVFEKGLKGKGASTNYFLHHVLLGHYLDRKDSLPAYLTEDFSKPPRLKFLNHLVQEVQSYSEFDLLSFSNIFDWMDTSDVGHLARKIGDEAKSGAYLVYRQLNNDKDLHPLFGKGFRFDKDLALKLHALDRSLFYSSLHVARKV